MTINKLTATFGKLDNETIEFHKGLNVISAPNESGKSTWCAFIMAMLYGINTSERPHGEKIPGKVRYQPWNGKAMCGTMEVTTHGRNITLVRSTPVNSAPMRDFFAFYTDSGIKTDDLSTLDAGEALTGVSAEAFARSAYIAQGDTVIPNGAENGKYILEVLSSGEKGTSFPETDSRLASWQRKRMYGRGSLISGKNEEMERIKNKLSDIQAIEADLQAGEEIFRQKKKQLSRLKEKACSLKKQYRQEMHIRISTAETDAVKEKDNIAIALEQAEKAASMIKKRQTVIALTTFATAVVLLVVTLLTKGNRIILGIAGGLFLVFLYTLLKKNAFGGRLIAVENAAREEKQRAEAAYQATLKKVRFLEDALTCGKMPQKYAKDMNCLKTEAFEVKKQMEALDRKTAVLYAKLEMAGDISSFKKRMEQLSQEIAELEEENGAIEIARKVLADADKEIQRDISPELSRKTTEYMSFLTNGKYNRIILDRDLSAIAAEKEDTIPHKSGFLSTGTRDLLSFSVRLAVCSLSQKKNESCPLIVDDAFVNLDKERARRVMELLEKIAEERQVLFFTCRD